MLGLSMPVHRPDCCLRGSHRSISLSCVVLNILLCIATTKNPDKITILYCKTDDFATNGNPRTPMETQNHSDGNSHLTVRAEKVQRQDQNIPFMKLHMFGSDLVGLCIVRVSGSPIQITRDTYLAGHFDQNG